MRRCADSGYIVGAQLKSLDYADAVIGENDEKAAKAYLLKKCNDIMELSGLGTPESVVMWGGGRYGISQCRAYGFCTVNGEECIYTLQFTPSGTGTLSIPTVELAQQMTKTSSKAELGEYQETLGGRVEVERVN